jgi:hypothetical protein
MHACGESVLGGTLEVATIVLGCTAAALLGDVIGFEEFD